MFSLNVSQPDYERELTQKNLKLTGKIDLSVLDNLLRYKYDYLDISEAEFGIDTEEWVQCLGWSHSGPVYGNRGERKVEVLRRFLEQINARTILLPDDVQRRHINSAKKNRHITELRVNEACPLFAYEDGKLMNKKKTMPVFGCKIYTVPGEIRGEWMTDQYTFDVIISNKEARAIKQLVKESDTDDFLWILDDKMPKLYDLLWDHFCSLAWKQTVRDGMDYYNLSRKEAEKADLTGYEFSVFVPQAFKPRK